MVNATKRRQKQLGEIILDTANVNGISTEFLEKSIQRLINILGTPAATYKDRIFRMLVKEKKIALEIYNAINDTQYDNPEDVIITTLENAVYFGMKNDVSFIIGSEQVLFEQAMEQAIDECIRAGILSEFLRKNRAEVMRMWLFEYDQEKHIEMEKEESYEDGKKEYIITLVIKLKHKGKTADEIANMLDEPLEKVRKIFAVSEKYAPDYDIQKIHQELENSEYQNKMNIKV